MSNQVLTVLRSADTREVMEACKATVCMVAYHPPLIEREIHRQREWHAKLSCDASSA